MNFLWAEKSNWFEQKGWIITLVLAIIMFAVFIVMVVLIALENKREKQKAKKIENDAYFYCFGGIDNIVSLEVKGSRLVVVLKDDSLLNENQLKILGITSLIRATNKITLIIGEKGKEILEAYNKKL